ncbi:hypothetical protein AB0I60_15640 [Actinosynnema sp. NPDC050436]|uniref:hypothetical protein n=1 Tax=Actinosynnema sp. NPDC050436 TaxID=3155659 RepID=UPI0033C20BE8
MSGLVLERSAEDVRDEFFGRPWVGVLGVASDDDRPPSIEQVVAVAARYMPEADARAFAAAELESPTGTFVLFTARPERWLQMGL